MSDEREFEREESNQELHDLEDLEREEEDDVADEKEANNEDSSVIDSKSEVSNGVDNNAQDDDDDDEDDEDDEEDDDDEDRVKSRKRARRDRNQFLDVEAEVSDDDEDDDEDDDDLTKEGFITADHEHDNEPITRDDRLHRQVDRSHEKSTEEDAQRLAAEFKERYGRTKYRGEDSGFVSQRFLLPSIHDPSIWAIQCRPGKEKETVKKLLQRKLTLHGKSNALQILSAFQRDGFTGYVYIEAQKLSAVLAAIVGFPDIYGGGKKILVPVEEYPDLLRASKSSEVKVLPGSYVRIKRGKYKGDLAIVDAIEENGLEVTLQIVPRIDYKGDIDEDTGKRKRITSKFRPAQRLFSKKDALENDASNLTVRSSNSFYYKGEEYIDGFLYKLYKLQFVETQNVHPSLEEVSRFNTGDDGELDLTSIAQSLKTNQVVAFNTGDRVQVLHGEQQGLQGDVVSASGEIATIKPRDFKGENMEFPLTNLRKIFTEGDHISVLRGKQAGHTGIVVSVDEDHVTFISDQSHKDVTVFANHLTKSTDSSTLIGGKYDLHDLVRVNATTVGVVVKADKDVYTVLSQEGKILSLSPTAIIEKIRFRKDQSFSADSNGSPIKIGDTVKENQGFKRQGAILHIFGSRIFIHSKEIPENNGIFVTDTTSVSNIAKDSVTGKQDEKLDLTKMNPKFRSGGQMAPPSIPIKETTGRDRTIDQHVSIRLGEYKGLRGVIKDTNGDIARVELHTKNKILSISKQKLSFVDRDGKLIPYEEFIRNKPDFRSGPSFSTAGSAGSRGSSTSGASSAWGGVGGGSKTPGWGNTSGNRTAYGGATAYGNNTSWGGATSNGGNATAWGNGGANTAWGGGAAGGNQSSWGGNQSSWGAGQGNRSSWGAAAGGQSAWGGANRGGASAYGGGSQWGGRSSYGNARQQGTWAQTPGSYNQAETPSANYNAQTPYETAQTPYEAAQTPNVAPTPGAHDYYSNE